MNDVAHDQATGEVMPIASTALEHLDTDITPGLRIIGTLEARAKLATELAAAVAEFTPIPKSRHVKFFPRKKKPDDPPPRPIEYDYSTYADIRKAIDGPLGRHGVAVSAFPHSVSNDTGGYRVTTLVAGHGAEIWSTLSLPKRAEWDMKVLGGDFTYLRRYGLAAAVGVEGDLDADDLPAEENQVRQEPEPPKPQAAKRSAPKSVPEQPKAESKTEPPKEDKPPKSNRPPAQEPLWTKTQKDEVTDLLMKLGYGNRPDAMRVRVREILGFAPMRDERDKSVLTKTQAVSLIAGLKRDLYEAQHKADEPPAQEAFDDPDFSGGPEDFGGQDYTP